MDTKNRRWLCCLVVVAGALVTVTGCTTKKLETADTSTTTTTRATGAANSSSSTTSSSASDSTTTSTPADVWSLNAAQYRGQDGLRVSLDCPPGNSAALYTVWGTGTYTDDSSVCMAGVHAGRISATEGGTVRIEISPGMESYEGSEANGVISLPYGQWDGSYSFVSE